MNDLIVIGGGPAGVTAALRARELGANVLLIERGRLGGTCTNDGCAPTRVLAKAARLMRDAEQLSDYGLSSSAPTLDLSRLLAATQQRIYRLQEKKQLLAHLDQAGVSVFSNVGPAQFVDAHTVALPNGDTHHAEKFILAVGGHARRLNFPGAELALTHSDVWTLKAAPKSLIVVGGAATGCQLASIFNAFGAHVTLLEVAPRILGVEDETVSRAITAAFQANGIDLIAGISGLEKIERSGDELTLTYKHQNEIHMLSAEAIILAVGWVGNVEQLNLPAAGVETARNYIQADITLRTSAPHIWTAGDINGQMMLVQSANAMGLIAAENAVLGESRKYHHHIVPHGGFTDPEYGSVGLTEAQARTSEGEVAVATVPYADLDRAVVDDRTLGFCKLIVSSATQRVLGVHVVGEQAAEVVQMASAGMAAGMTVTQLANLELAYPTFTAIIGLAARQLVRDLGLTPLAERWANLRQLERSLPEWERRTN